MNQLDVFVCVYKGNNNPNSSTVITRTELQYSTDLLNVFGIIFIFLEYIFSVWLICQKTPNV